MGGTALTRAVSSVAQRNAGKNATGKSAAGPAGGKSAARNPGGKPAAKAENDVQRRMREALETKTARNKAAHGEDHLGGRNVGPSTNDKTQRQFRRKSG